MALHDLAKFDQFRKKFDYGYRTAVNAERVFTWPDEVMTGKEGKSDDDLYS